MTEVAQTARERLAAGPGRGLGCAEVIAAEALQSEALLQELIAALDDPRPCVLARAANALKKVQAKEARALDPFAGKLVKTALACPVREARWNLVLLLGKLPLHGRDRALAIELLFEAFSDSSALVRTFAMQALADLGQQDPALRRRVRPVVEWALTTGTAAMQARARKLLPKLSDQPG